MTVKDQERLEVLKKEFDESFTAKEAAEVLDLSVSATRKLLNRLASENILTVTTDNNSKPKRNIYTFVVNKKSTRKSSKKSINKYDVYFNDSFVMSIECDANQIRSIMKNIYGDDDLEVIIEGNSINIMKELGSKG